MIDVAAKRMMLLKSPRLDDSMTSAEGRGDGGGSRERRKADGGGLKDKKEEKFFESFRFLHRRWMRGQGSPDVAAGIGN